MRGSIAGYWLELLARTNWLNALDDRDLQMLDDIYRELDLQRGQLLKPSEKPTTDVSASDWTNTGEWLILASRMNAERVFFVQDSPVIVFSEVEAGNDRDAAIVRAYRRAWSMARPKCLFIATGEEIRVYSLSKPPVDSVSRIEELTPVEIVSRTADVARELADFSRGNVEDGRLFETARIEITSGAHDQFLRDVDAATRILESQGLPQSVAHGLIERVVLIRYLEDREVLPQEYFEQIAFDSAIPLNVEDMSAHGAVTSKSFFLSCLSSFDLTRAVFSDLARRFNGDLFVFTDSDEQLVTAEHLYSLQRLFGGEGFSNQAQLFLWAYDFSVVPTSLISSMYEQFYHSGTADDSGTYYTPAELVEYSLSRVLTEDVLSSGPRVCDAACGSGIFLVEAFRRIVRFEMTRDGTAFSSATLRKLLVERVAGVDTNHEAVRLAAFSLYLAYLNYLSPRVIMEAGPLPRLISSGLDGEATVLVVSDAFNDTDTEAAGKLPGVLAIPWTNGSFDIVVGNPPWTEPKSGRSLADAWARSYQLPVGDRSPSQLFLWRALSLLREGACGGLLVSASVFGNARSKEFRNEWLKSVELLSIVNFSAVRRLFFSGGIAPFALMQFRKNNVPSEGKGRRFEYLTMIPSTAFTSSRSVSYARSERKWVDQAALLRRDYLWKTYFWGGHRDADLMARLDLESCLSDYFPIDGPMPRYGFQWGNKQNGHLPSERLAALPSLKSMESWGPLRPEWIEAVDRPVKREPDERMYSGRRIVVSRGVRSGFGPRVRMFEGDLAFRHNFYCIPMDHVSASVARAFVGIALSMLGRYHIFMTSGSWGLWYDSIVPDDIKALPVRVEEKWAAQVEEIASVVVELEQLEVEELTLFNHDGQTLEEILDRLNSLVFDLFELTSAERALVADWDKYTLDLARRSERSTAILPLPLAAGSYAGASRSTVAALASFEAKQYLDTLISIWDAQLAPIGHFSWRLLVDPALPYVAAVLETRESGESLGDSVDDLSWPDVFHQLAEQMSKPVTQSIRIDGFVRAVSQTSVIVAKRNEVRLWSSSAAIDDAEATMLRAIALED